MSKKQELRVGSWSHLSHITPTVLIILAVICTPLAMIAEFMTGAATFSTYISAALFGCLLCSVFAWLVLFVPGYFIYGYFHNLRK